MGTISSRTSNKNMGNTCSHIDDKPTQPEGSPVKLFTVLPGSVSPPPLLHRGDSNQQGAVCIDHSDIRLRAESEFSNSTQDADRTSNIYVKYQGDCLKNGQILSVVLLPHQHTLFCERKQRVCTAMGKVQEMEVLRMQGLEAPLSGCVWIRTAANANANSAYEPIPNSDNQMEYHLTADDVDCFISFRHSYMVPGATEPTVIQAEHSVGPVLAGPARLLDLRILGFSQSYTTTAEGEAAFNGVFRVGRAVIANTKYIGGKQGCSEFWWLKTNSDGNREELSKRAAIDAQHIDKDLTYLLDIENVLENEEVVNSGVLDDPRVYVIKSQDCGATLKVKCVPVRGDNYNGEVCTSKPSAVIEGELKEQSNNDNTYISELSISETNI